MKVKDISSLEVGYEVPLKRAYKNVFLRNLQTQEFELKEPLPVNLIYDIDDEQYVAVSYDLNLFGYGDTESEAISDLCAAMIEYYEDLLEDPKNIGAELIKDWNFFQQILKRTQCN